ncbi:hypothetical protein ElyMa_003966200 [Elysia marginata]|uniref:Uncharacterized protein n=1 Tax=Elysia marginata TaxID=1093978 RepID=A0AAV4FW84_9GAST|nr:hypothetical protein ElyMa_003966200 [Elysia marginata]
MSYINSICGRVPAHDIFVSPEVLGKPAEYPYCLINVKTTSNNRGRLCDYLQKLDPEVRDEDAMTDFLNLIDRNKTLWGIPFQHAQTAGHFTYKPIKIQLQRSTALVNTGLFDLHVGNKLYALPAIVPLAKRSTCNRFRYDNKEYIHPMLLDQTHLNHLAMDVLDLKTTEDFNPRTLMGRFFKDRLYQSDDMEKLLNYITCMRSIGNIESNFKFTTPTVHVGGEFTLRANEFGV